MLVLLAVLGIGLLADPPEAAAQMYRWTDDQGEAHFTLGIDSVPPRYQRKAVLMGEIADPPGSRPPTPSTAAAPAAPSGGARIQFTPGKAIMVTAKINDGGTAQLELDTGASATTINPAVLTALGVSYRTVRRGVMKGVTGQADVWFVSVRSIDVGGARFGPLWVVAHDTGSGIGSDGLLGRDFLDKFTVNIDNGAGIVTLTPKQRQ